MEHGVFRAWLAGGDDLTVEQRLELEEVLSRRPPCAAVTAVIETSPGDERRCPHCGHGASVGCGQADGLRRFRCKGCGRSFNALTPCGGSASLACARTGHAVGPVAEEGVLARL